MSFPRENNQMKHELTRLGYEVPRTTWSYTEQQAHEREQQEKSQHPPEPQHASSSSGRKRTRDDYLEGRIEDPPEQQFVPPGSMLPPPLPRQSRVSKPAVEMYSGGEWRDARTSDEVNALPTLPSSSQNHGQYLMSGALPPQARHTQQNLQAPQPYNGFVRQDRQAQAMNAGAGNARDSNESVLAYQKPHDVSRNRQDSAYQHGQYELNANQGRPSGPAMRQPLIVVPDRGNLPQRGTSTKMTNSGYTHGRLLPTRDSVIAPAVQPVPHMSRVMQSPFFNSSVSPQSYRLNGHMNDSTVHHDNLASSLGRMRMDLDQDAPPKTRSLNTLSFIQEPYSQSNKPVFTRPESRTPWSRAAVTRQDQQFPMQPGQPVSYISDPRLSTGYSPAAAPLPRHSSRQHAGRTSNTQITGMRGVKGSSMMGGMDGGYGQGGVSNGYRFPYQQQRGLGTATGRRSVRR